MAVIRTAREVLVYVPSLPRERQSIVELRAARGETLSRGASLHVLVGMARGRPVREAVRAVSRVATVHSMHSRRRQRAGSRSFV